MGFLDRWKLVYSRKVSTRVKALYLHRHRQTAEGKGWALALQLSSLPPAYTFQYRSPMKGQSRQAKLRACQRSLPAAEAGHPALLCLLSDCNVASSSHFIWLRANTEGTEAMSTQELLGNIRNHVMTVLVAMIMNWALLYYSRTQLLPISHDVCVSLSHVIQGPQADVATLLINIT